MSASSPVLAIDGPSGSGKGTVSALIALRLGWHLLDSGALYRILAYKARQMNLPLSAEDALTRVAGELDVAFIPPEAPADGELPGDTRVLLDGADIGDAIRSDDIGQAASRVAMIVPVRQALMILQRSFARPPGLVADGRDMGSVVFPAAEIKIFLTASVEARAGRRHKQLISKGLDVSVRDLLRSMQERDDRDRERSVAPLVAAPGAHVLDTSEMSINQVTNQVHSIIQEKLR